MLSSQIDFWRGLNTIENTVWFTNLDAVVIAFSLESCCIYLYNLPFTMSSMLSSCGWRAEASARNKTKMEWLPSIWNWSEVEISSFVSLGFSNCIPRFRGSLDRDVDSIDDSWKYCSKFYSKIYIIVLAKTAVHSRATNHSAGHAREANHSASDPDDLSANCRCFFRV